MDKVKYTVKRKALVASRYGTFDLSKKVSQADLKKLYELGLTDLIEAVKVKDKEE